MNTIAPFMPKFEQYFVDISVDCPYGLTEEAVYHQALFSSIPDGAMSCFFEKGYRRNGNYIYTMHCPKCRKCVPIRLRPTQFEPDRNQRRVMAKNKDVKAGIAPLTMSNENLSLLDRFLDKRFPNCKSSAAGYYSSFFLSSIIRSFEIRYRLEDKLIGVAIVDWSHRWLNAVYFYFDPDQAHRSPGIFNILYLINLCNLHRIDFLYLGYWISDVSSMAYKANFRPHEILDSSGWKGVSKKPGSIVP